MVKDVEDLCPKFKLEALGHRRRLQDGKIEVIEAWPHDLGVRPQRFLYFDTPYTKRWGLSL